MENNRTNRISFLVLQVEHALRRRAGLRSYGQRSGGQSSEYHRQFSWKKPATAASPILTAEQVRCYQIQLVLLSTIKYYHTLITHTDCSSGTLILPNTTKY